MSAYSDWRCGALSDEEFMSAMRRECEDVDFYDRATCFDCASYDYCREQVARLGYPQCEQGEGHFEDQYDVYEALQDDDFKQQNYGCTDTESILSNFDLVDIFKDWKDYKNAGTDK